MSIVAHKYDIFQQVRGVNFIDVFSAFSNGEVKRNKVLCPFHAERTPSFHIYPTGFHCFSCGVSGDGIGFVAKLHGLRPLDAARLIASRFGLPVGGQSPPDVLAKAQREWTQAQRERQLRAGLDRWAYDTARRVRILIDAIYFLFAEHGVDIPGDMLPLVHRLETFEFWRDCLLDGDTEQRLGLYRDPGLRGWFA